VPRTWLEVEVVLVGVAEREDEDPGRVFVVGRAHSFAQLADAINVAFARFDLSHLHEFELADGRRLAFPTTSSPRRSRGRITPRSRSPVRWDRPTSSFSSLASRFDESADAATLRIGRSQ
jgi:hypothetical protein